MITDIVAALTDSVQPSGYIKDMRRRDPELAKGWGQIATPLSMDTVGGKQELNCANTEGVFRIIQSIPSPKAEPFKRWLAKNKQIVTFLNPCLKTGILAIIKLWAEEKYKKKMFALSPNLQTEEVIR